jgi:hypothetical protein
MWLPDRKSDTLAAWLSDHPGVEIVVRDGSTTYAEAVRRAVPSARQVSDRWHLWHGLARVAEKLVSAHSNCWAKAGPQRQALTREHTTLERWHAIHNLLQHGVGLLDCSRRLGLSLNTVKRYARVTEPQRLRRPPQYRACLVDDYRDHLRARRAAEPGIPVQRLFAEIKTLGYTGGLNLLYKYINQGRLNGDRITPSPRRLTRWLLTKPANLSTGKRAHLEELLASCPEMTALAQAVRDFARLMTDRRGTELDDWIRQVRDAKLIGLEPFLAGARARSRRGDRWADPALQQWSHRRRQHENQTDQETNVRPRKLSATPTPYPPQLIKTPPPKVGQSRKWDRAENF